MKKCRVLHIAPGFLYGGIEARLIDWYSYINRDKITLDVVKVTPEIPNSNVERINALGGQVYSISPLGAKSIFRHIKELKQVIRKGNYDIIHSHASSYSYFAFKEAKKLGIKTRVLHIRTTNHSQDERGLWFKTILGKASYRHVTHFFACSKEAGEWAFGQKRELQVIRNGIELERFEFSLPVRNEIRNKLSLTDNFVVGSVGRFAAAKNMLFLVDIFYEVYKNKSNARLILVGDGPLKESIQERITYYKLQDVVIFAGFQSNINEWMQAFDVFLFPSLFEGFGTVALEAQTAGLPVITSNTIPYSIKVSPDLVFMPLDESASKWAKEVDKYSNQRRKSANIEGIRKAGYDVAETARWLEDFYLSHHIN